MNERSSRLGALFLVCLSCHVMGPTCSCLAASLNPDLRTQVVIPQDTPIGEEENATAPCNVKITGGFSGRACNNDQQPPSCSTTPILHPICVCPTASDLHTGKVVMVRVVTESSKGVGTSTFICCFLQVLRGKAGRIHNDVARQPRTHMFSK